jgi:predicted phage tail protein
VPVVAGAGGLGKVVLGAALIVASFYMPTYFTTQGLFAATNLSSIASSIGWSLVLGGVSADVIFPA